MKVTINMAFSEPGALRLLNWLADENERILSEMPYLPALYDSGVQYRRETGGEVWCDYLTMLSRGHEDCDGLSAARAGELRARGYKALRPGDGGYRAAREQKLKTIGAWVMLKTRSPEDRPGLYHCIVRYKVGNRWYRDDPSARLGMRGEA